MAGRDMEHLEYWHYLLLALCGAAAGFVDAIAGGGGLLTVPALLWAGLPPAMALGTNKMQSACGTALAVWTYARAGMLRDVSWRLPLAVTIVSAAAGAWFVSRLDGAFLKHVIPWLLAAVAVYMGVSKRVADRPRAVIAGPVLFALAAGGALGFYDGFFGPGTGAFWAVAAVTLRGMELGRATAFTKLMNLGSNAASLAVFLAAGQVAGGVALVMICGQLVGARLGAGLVVRRGGGVVRPVLMVTVLLMAAKLFIENAASWR